MTKAIGYVRGFLLVSAQLVGAILASFLVQVLFPYEFNVRTTLSASTSVARGVFIEMILTAELVFTVFMLAKEKHKATYMAPVGIGLALFVAELVGVFFTGGSLSTSSSPTHPLH
jgi:aquaporin rerated protein, other eukaryote